LVSDDLSAIDVADREAQRRARQEQAEAAEAMAAANKEMEDEEAAAQEVQQAEAKLKKAEEEGLSSAIVQHLRVLAANKRKEFRVRLPRCFALCLLGLRGLLVLLSSEPLCGRRESKQRHPNRASSRRPRLERLGRRLRRRRRRRRTWRRRRSRWIASRWRRT